MVAADTILRLILEMERFSLSSLFIRLPSLQGDALFGRPFLSHQDVSSLPTSPTSDAAAPDVNVPLPFALSGASLSLHA